MPSLQKFLRAAQRRRKRGRCLSTPHADFINSLASTGVRVASAQA